MTTAIERFDGVLVAGGGPVGLTTALRLARAGVPVRVLEAGDGLSQQSRASTFHAATLEMLDELGVADDLVARGLIARTFQFRDRDEGVIAELDMGVLAGDTRFPFRLQVNQSVLAELVLERLAGIGHASVAFSTRLVEVATGPDEATAVVEDGQGRRRIAAPYVVAADGARSAARASLGIGFEGLTYPERYLVAGTTLDLRELLPDLAYVNYVGDPRQWYVVLATPSAWRVLFPVPLDVPDEEVTDDERVQSLLRAVADIGRPWPVVNKQLYKVHQRLATTFRVGRVCLAGDAAHINNPLGGMGMNSGIHDAVDLGGRLATMFHGGHDEASLDAYARERRRIAGEYVNRETDRNWSRLREEDPAARARQHAVWRELKADPARERDYLLRASMLASVRATSEVES